MELRYFLGANSAAGFISYYAELNHGSSAVLTRIIKGGPGCGKSTLMKRVAEYAASQGLDTIKIPCASDPDSLDGILIPAAGYAIADGTSPHVIEPRLCGCKELYLDLSSAYRYTEMILHRDVLIHIQDAGKACYVPAQAALQAAAALEQSMQSGRSPLTEALATSIAEKEFPAQNRQALEKHCFFSGYTPSGYIYYQETIQTLCSSVYLLHGTRSETTHFLRQLAAFIRANGWDLVIGSSPLQPGQYIDQLLIPQRGIAFVREMRECPWRLPAAKLIGNEAEANIHELEMQLRDLAIGHLRRAKEYHDLLEQTCAPFVDFSVADRLTQQCCRELDTLLESNRS